MKKVLITGGAGFIGSHLTEAFLNNNCKVYVLDNLSTGKLKNLAHLMNNSNLKINIGSVLNEELVKKLVCKCDNIFHLASAVGVKLIIERPLECLINNIKGTEIMLRMAYTYNKKILITSTSEIYGRGFSVPFKENENGILSFPLKIRWSYSLAKTVEEMMAYIYCQRNKLPLVVVRLFNTAGPRQVDKYGMVIPAFINQAVKNKPITVFGNGKQTRCFIHVKDVVNALIRLMKEPKAKGQIFNIGGKEEISIKQLAKEIIRLTKSRSKIVYIPYEKAYKENFEDIQRRVPDTTKIRKLIGFKPGYTLYNIIKDIVNYSK